MPKRRTNVMIDEEQIKGLKTLSSITRVRMSEYIREGIDMVLSRYQKELKKAPKKERGVIRLCQGEHKTKRKGGE